MSEDQSDREWRFYIEGMIGFCERVQNFTRDITREEFLTEPMRYDATVRNIELIGEAATHVPAAIREAVKNISWRMVTATRNRCRTSSPSATLLGSPFWRTWPCTRRMWPLKSLLEKCTVIRN